jgi:hypothetical protein
MNEGKPITRVFFVKMKKAFLDLPDEEKQAYMMKDRANLDDLGMKAISMINCGWSNDEWDYIGIEEWPSLEAIKKREIFEHGELQIDKYTVSKTYLGTAETFDDYGKG